MRWKEAGKERYAIDRKVRRIAVAVRPGRTPLVLRLRLAAAGKTTLRTLTIPRR